MEEKLDLITLKQQVDSGNLDVPRFIVLIDQKIEALNNDIDSAKRLVDTARSTGGDFLGLGSKGRVEALATALSQTNETISSTHELIRCVIGLVLCSASFADKLIKASAELFGGRMEDADGRIVKMSEQTERFIRSVIEIAKGVVTTQTELKQEVTDAKSALEGSFKSQVNLIMDGMKELEDSYTQKVDSLLEDVRKITCRQDAAIGANRKAIQSSEAKINEQDRLLIENARIDEAQDVELKRQADKDKEHDEKIAANKKNIDENAQLIALIKETLQRHRHEIAGVKVNRSSPKAAIILSVVALVTSIVALLFSVLH